LHPEPARGTLSRLAHCRAPHTKPVRPRVRLCRPRRPWTRPAGLEQREPQGGRAHPTRPSPRGAGHTRPHIADLEALNAILARMQTSILRAGYKARPRASTRHSAPPEPRYLAEYTSAGRWTRTRTGTTAPGPCARRRHATARVPHASPRIAAARQHRVARVSESAIFGEYACPRVPSRGAAGLLPCC
jgi:hypothetical protein